MTICFHTIPECNGKTDRIAISISSIRNLPNLKAKIQDGGARHIEFRKISVTLDWMKIFAPVPGKMHHGHRMIGGDKRRRPEVYTRDVIKGMCVDSRVL